MEELKPSLILKLSESMVRFDHYFDDIEITEDVLHQLDSFTYDIIEAFECAEVYRPDSSSMKLGWFIWFLKDIMREYQVLLEPLHSDFYENLDYCKLPEPIDSHQYKLMIEFVETCKSLNNKIANYFAISELSQ
jgi:hypothetical protein